MPDFIKGIITDMILDYARQWWWVPLPIVGLIALKYLKRGGVLILLLLAAAGGYLMGARRPAQVVTNTVEKRVEIPVDRIIEKRVEVPTIVEKIKEVFVTKEVPFDPYGKCIFCGRVWHLDGASGAVRCPRCGKQQKANSASQNEKETQDAAANYIPPKLTIPLPDPLAHVETPAERHEKMVREQKKSQPYNAICTRCKYMVMLPPGSERFHCPKCLHELYRQDCMKNWNIYTAFSALRFQAENLPPIPMKDLSYQQRLKLRDEEEAELQNKIKDGTLRCPKCNWINIFGLDERTTQCRHCKHNYSRDEGKK